MFQPASLKGESPVPIDEKVRKRYIFLYLIVIILSSFPLALFEYFFIISLWKEGFYWLFLLLLPLNVIISIYILLLSAILFSSLFLKIINLIHLPKEGQFKRDISDKNYLYWNIRNIVKKWPLYLNASNPFPWFKNRSTLRCFGIRIGKNTICDNSWISSEFVKVGKNVIIGMNSTIISFGIEQDKLILKSIIIEDDVVIGAKCVLLPGTIVKKGAKISAHSFTNYNSILEENLIYLGHPAKLKK